MNFKSFFILAIFLTITNARESAKRQLATQNLDPAFASINPGIVVNQANPSLQTTQNARFIDTVSQAALQAQINVSGRITTNTQQQQQQNVFSNLRAPGPLCPFTQVFCDPAARFRSFDGSCNNLQNPWWGKSETPYKRYLAPAYDDGVGAPRSRGVSGNLLPNPRLISTIVALDNSQTERFYTHVIALFGQFLAHDMSSASISSDANGATVDCPCGVRNPSCLSVEIASTDNLLKMSCMKFTRSSAAFPTFDCNLGRREQLNILSGFPDGTGIYGANSARAASLRTLVGGKLRSTERPNGRPLLLQFDDATCRDTRAGAKCFAAGEGRTNENLGLASLHTLFMRFHNNIAQQLARLQPKWSDEELYQQTRRIVLATYQHITYNEYVPAVIGMRAAQLFDIQPLKTKTYFSGYDQNLNPSIANDFSAAAFRFGHTLIRNSLSRANVNNQITGSIPLGNMIFRPVEAHNDREGGIDTILFGMLNDPASKYDTSFADTLQNHLFEFRAADGSLVAVDLIATNINRGRDHGLPSYNTYREMCGFRRAATFDQLVDTIPAEKIQQLSRLYENVEDIDLYVGGLSEVPLAGAVVGPIFACIIGNQFSDLKRGDRFYYENGPSNTALSLAQLNEIRKMSLASIICDNTDLLEIQPSAFLLPSQSINNTRIACSSAPRLDLTAWTIAK